MGDVQGRMQSRAGDAHLFLVPRLWGFVPPLNSAGVRESTRILRQTQLPAEMGGFIGVPPLISPCNLINYPSAQTEKKKVKTNLRVHSMLLSYFAAAMLKSGLREEQGSERERKSPFPF